MGKDEPGGASAVDESLSTATAAKPARWLTLARGAVVPSRTNPRTHFDAAYIKELATSIAEHGMLQPILVRPLPGDRLQDTFDDRKKGDPLPTHEVVCGECRWRASGVANVEQLLVLERDLDDLEVLQIQLVENLKRRDLHPLEEAEGFERLMKDHGLTVDDIAARIDKSVSYIFKLRKLLDLTPECRETLYQGKLTQSTALLVARAPAYLQAKIAKDIMEDGFDDEPMSFRQAARHIQQHYMLRLAEAVFDIKDANLVAKAGACGACPKNTGSNKDLFGDVSGGDQCTDSKCFDSKKVAHFAAVAKAAEAKGQTVIQGKEAKEIWPNEYGGPKGYERLDAQQYINGKHTTLRKLLGKELPTPIIVVDPHSKAAVEVLRVDIANKLLKKATAAAKAQLKAKDPTSQVLERDFDERWQTRTIEQLHAAILTGKGHGITVAIARVIAKHFARDLYGDSAKLFARLFDVPASKVATSAGIDDFLGTCPDHQVGPALLLLIAFDEFEYEGGSNLKTLPVLRLIAEDYGVDLKALQDEVKAQMKSEAAERASGAKTARTAPASKKPATTPRSRTPHQAFMAPLYCAPQLQAIVGSEPMPRTEIVSGLWAYIKKHKLQDNVNKRMVNCDEKLKALFGKSEVSMFEMAGLVGKSAGPKPFTDAATAPAASTSTKTKKKTTAAAAKAGISQALKDAATKDACAAALGCKVRVKATHETHAGKEGILGPSMGDSWHITFSGDAGKNTGRVNRDDFIVIQNPAQAAWPFPTAHKP